jgi:hypothetical protein
MIDYLKIAQEYFHRGKYDDRLFLTDIPTSINLAEDAFIKVRYDSKAMQKATDAFGLPRWIPHRAKGFKSIIGWTLTNVRALPHVKRILMSLDWLSRLFDIPNPIPFASRKNGCVFHFSPLFP